MSLKDIEQTSQSPPAERPIRLSRIADVIGSGCSFPINTDNELDNDCQSSCGLDQPQAYENQEPLERPNPEKEVNDTFIRPLEPSSHDKQPSIPLTLERNNNNTEPLKSENESFKSQLHNVDIIAESNFLDSNKQNLTENGTRMKRGVRLVRRIGPGTVRVVRQTNEAILGSSDENLSLQSEEIAWKECDKVNVGVSSKSVSNSSLFLERVCPRSVYNYTYTVPLSHCLHHKHVDITFRATKLKEFHRCDSADCRREAGCRKLSYVGDSWNAPLTLGVGCGSGTVLKIRGAFTTIEDLCKLTPEDNLPFVEYNIRIYRDCNN
ncbi:uncharacterized protein LOC114363360 [Ostrinia furnacalis]|uniref:uncharacterized protein LOC114363360 n=1 Tax=Ostrinia furnacalis TaxID=93504 RepID=UPI00103AF128|nr:uncharacterized protein LOC114363360 [Ostrinia furnacalis]